MQKKNFRQGFEKPHQIPLIKQLQKYSWEWWLHPAFNRHTFAAETNENEHKAIKMLVNDFIHRLNVKKHGKRYKRKNIAGISTAFILEYAHTKKYHSHFLIDGWEPLPPEEIYNTWIECGGAKEPAGVPIVRATDVEVAFGAERCRGYNGREKYFMKHFPATEYDRRGVYGYTTAQADVAIFKMWRAEEQIQKR